jgi:hypothetical protein
MPCFEQSLEVFATRHKWLVYQGSAVDFERVKGSQDGGRFSCSGVGRIG